jgi:hypothetical protein
MPLQSAVHVRLLSLVLLTPSLSICEHIQMVYPIPYVYGIMTLKIFRLMETAVHPRAPNRGRGVLFRALSPSEVVEGSLLCKRLL